MGLCGIVVIYAYYKIYQDFPLPRLTTCSLGNSSIKKVCSWNIKFLPIIESTFERRDEICRVLKEKNADVICLQECFSSYKQHKKFFDENFKEYNAVFSPKSSLFLTDAGLAIFSKAKIDEHVFYKYSTSEYSDYLAGKGILAARFGDLWIMSTHLQANYGDTTQLYSSQVKQLIELKAFINKFQGKRVVLVGDINVDISNKTHYNCMRTLLSEVRLYSDPKAVTTDENTTLDHVWSNCEVKDIEIAPKMNLSDHRLVSVNL